MTELNEEKALLREKLSDLRQSASRHHDAVVATLAGYAAELVKALRLKQGDIVAGFWPIKSELDPRPLMAALVTLGMGSALPATSEPEKPLVFHAWQDGDAVIDGLYGTSEPEPAARMVIPKVILLPMLAFDDSGGRLGYGGGFYDRTLTAMRAEGHSPHAVGIAYECQRIEQIPMGEHDARLDAVLTESGLYEVG